MARAIWDFICISIMGHKWGEQSPFVLHYRALLAAEMRRLSRAIRDEING